MRGNYTTVQDIAKKWDVTPRVVQKMCLDGRIEGAIKFGRSWAIPEETNKPKDQRIRNGEWVGYRRRTE